MTAGEDLESMIYLTNNCSGFYYDEPLMLYVEDREVNLKKSIISNNSHLKTIIKAYNLKITKIDYFSYLLIIQKLWLKILILKILKFYPKIYLLTVSRRAIVNDPKEYVKHIINIDKIKEYLNK